VQNKLRRFSRKKCAIDGDFVKSLKLLFRLMVTNVDKALFRHGIRPFDWNARWFKCSSIEPCICRNILYVLSPVLLKCFTWFTDCRTIKTCVLLLKYSILMKVSGKKKTVFLSLETQKFYKALSQVGTDFSLMGPLFPNRKRRELKVCGYFGLFSQQRKKSVSSVFM